MAIDWQDDLEKLKVPRDLGEFVDTVRRIKSALLELRARVALLEENYTRKYNTSEYNTHAD